MRPPRLSEGDRVALVSPSGVTPPEQVDAGVAVLRAWGLDVVVAPHARDTHAVHGYLAGDDAARAEDFTAAWSAPDVRAVVCVRGGYGAQRMVDLVEWDALRAAEPKVLVGFSDVTVLHQAVAARLGVVTLHGPMTGTKSFLDSSAAQAHLRATLFEPESVQLLGGAPARALVGGVAAGVTTGGCLSLLASSVGTPTALGTARGGLVLLEDVDEKAYRVDGYLTHLRRTGWFDGVAGIALGSWSDCEPTEPVIADLLGGPAGLGVPILADLGFGHCRDAITIPLGVEAELDADKGTLTLEQPALT